MLKLILAKLPFNHCKQNMRAVVIYNIIFPSKRSFSAGKRRRSKTRKNLIKVREIKYAAENSPSILLSHVLSLHILT